MAYKRIRAFGMKDEFNKISQLDIDSTLTDAIGGDKRAEQRLFQHLFVRFKYLAKRIASEDDAHDLAQEACTTVFQKYKDETFTVSFQAWSYGVLKMKIGNYLQSSKRRSQREASFNESVAAPGNSASPILKPSLLECLREIFSTQPRYARILNLSHQGFSTDEICNRLKMTANHYYVSLNRSRSLLKLCLQGKGAIA